MKRIMLAAVTVGAMSVAAVAFAQTQSQQQQPAATQEENLSKQGAPTMGAGPNEATVPAPKASGSQVQEPGAAAKENGSNVQDIIRRGGRR